MSQKVSHKMESSKNKAFVLADFVKSLFINCHNVFLNSNTLFVNKICSVASPYERAIMFMLRKAT